jgi:hypothetical protein
VGRASQLREPAHPACVAGDDACGYNPVMLASGPAFYMCQRAWEEECHATCALRFLTVDLKTVLLRGPVGLVTRSEGIVLLP